MKTIAPQIQQLQEQVARKKEHVNILTAGENEEVISVDHVASRIAHMYEKMRYSVDYKEEHLLRKNAIERMLKRRLLENFRKKHVAHAFIVELVRAGYLPNEKLPARIITDVEYIIDKAKKLYLALPHASSDDVLTSQEFKRVVSLAAAEIEEFLFPSETAEATVNTLYLTVNDLIEVKEKKITEDVKNVQVYIACARSLLGYDEASVFYRLWLLHNPEWRGDVSDEEIERIARSFHALEKEIYREIEHPLNWRLMPKFRDYSIYFSLIKESIDKNPNLWLAEELDVDAVKRNVTKLLAQKYAREKDVISKSVNRAIIYILLTKIILAFLLELPYDMWVAGKVNKMALIVNVLFHPILLFVATRVVRLPRQNSRQHTVKSIIAIIEGKTLPRIPVWIERKRSLFGIILTVIYVFFVGVIFGGIVWTLKTLEFNMVSGALFILFLTLVSYFALRIRNRAKKWRVTPRNTTARGFLIDLLTLPIVQAGQWITKKFDKVNIFVFVMDFLIETPFKMLVDIFEGFTHYLREKKESME